MFQLIRLIDFDDEYHVRKYLYENKQTISTKQLNNYRDYSLFRCKLKSFKIIDEYIKQIMDSNLLQNVIN